MKEPTQTTKTAIDANTKLAADAFDLKRTTYKNWISYKFDNRRVTVLKTDTGFGFQFRSIDPDYSPHAKCECIHGIVAQTSLSLSKEAAEIIMMSLAELMGFSICR